MNSLAWIGVIAWGILVTFFGLFSAGSPGDAAPDVQPHDVLMLCSGGLLTCMIGITGLLGFIGWIPGLRK
jgi:hypothetical protein